MYEKLVNIVRNFRNGKGWESVVLGEDELRALHALMREATKEIVEESLYDARDLTLSGLGLQDRPDLVLELAMFLASKRILDAKAFYEEVARQQMWMARKTGNDDKD